MKVTVRLFATLRQLAGWREQEIDLPEGATVETLMETVEVQNPSLTLRHRSVYAAVNQTYVGSDTVLQNGDEIAFMPPVSGGSKGETSLSVGRKNCNGFDLTTRRTLRRCERIPR